MSNERVLTIPYPDDLLLALNESEDTFAQEARLLLAIKLYEMGRISTGMAARLSGMSRLYVRTWSFRTLSDCRRGW